MLNLLSTVISHMRQQFAIFKSHCVWQTVENFQPLLVIVIMLSKKNWKYKDKAFLSSCFMFIICPVNIDKFFISFNILILIYFKKIIYLFLPCHEVWRILTPWPRIKPVPPAVGGWRLNHWTFKEVLIFQFFNGMKQPCMEYSKYAYFLEEIFEILCSLQHYSKQPGDGSNPNNNWHINGFLKCGIYIH